MHTRKFLWPKVYDPLQQLIHEVNPESTQPRIRLYQLAICILHSYCHNKSGASMIWACSLEKLYGEDAVMLFDETLFRLKPLRQFCQKLPLAAEKRIILRWQTKKKKQTLKWMSAEKSFWNPFTLSYKSTHANTFSAHAHFLSLTLKVQRLKGTCRSISDYFTMKNPALTLGLSVTIEYFELH